MRVTLSGRGGVRRGRGTPAGWRHGTLAAAAMTILGTSCFVHPINRAPQVLSINVAGPFRRGQEGVSFTATVTDPDGDPVDLSWAATPGGNCPPKDNSGSWPARTAASTFTVGKELTNDAFCVWVFATDRYGAMTVLNNVFSPGDRPPVAAIDAGPTMPRYRLYTTFKVDGSGSQDPDGDPIKKYNWTLQAPSGTPLSFVDCETGPSTATRCFQANQPGIYTVSLTVEAGAASAPTVTSAAAVVKLDVLDDTPPCLDSSNHGLIPMTTIALNPHLDADMSFFQVTVFDDDGGLFPPANPAQHITYSWFMTAPGAPPGSPLVAQDTLLNTLPIEKDRYMLTDETVVRVEIHDRNVEAIDQHLHGDCADAPFCSTTDPITGKTCYQRFSWNVKWIL